MAPRKSVNSANALSVKLKCEELDQEEDSSFAEERTRHSSRRCSKKIPLNLDSENDSPRSSTSSTSSTDSSYLRRSMSLGTMFFKKRVSGGSKGKVEKEVIGAERQSLNRKSAQKLGLDLDGKVLKGSDRKSKRLSIVRVR